MKNKRIFLLLSITMVLLFFGFKSQVFASQVTKDDIIAQLKPLTVNDNYSKVYFKINPTVEQTKLSENLNKLKDNTKPISITLYVKDEDNLLKEIQSALDAAQYSKTPIIVYIPKGQYHVEKTFHIYSNTWLRLEPGTEIIRSTTKLFPFILNGDTHASYKGYDGESNIVIDGGVWNSNADVLGTGSTAFSIGHGHNIIVQNVTIKNVYNGHAIDMAGDKNVMVRNSQFLGYKNQSGSRDFSEAIQIDGFISDKSFPSFGTVDYTLTTNVIISNNEFGKSDSKKMDPWATAIGSHSALYEKAFSNIYIDNNTFNGMTYSAIRTRHWSNVSIYQNTFINTQKGVWLDVTKASIDMNGKHRDIKLKMDNFLVKDNVFKGTKGLAIDTDGSNSSYITNLKISNNKILK